MTLFSVLLVTQDHGGIANRTIIIGFERPNDNSQALGWVTHRWWSGLYIDGGNALLTRQSKIRMRKSPTSYIQMTTFSLSWFIPQLILFPRAEIAQSDFSSLHMEVFLQALDSQSIFSSRIQLTLSLEVHAPFALLKIILH